MSHLSLSERRVIGRMPQGQIGMAQIAVWPAPVNDPS